MTGVVPRHERAHAAQGRPERPRARPQRLQRRTELVGQRVRLAEPALRRLERGRQLAQRRAQVGVLARERGEHGVRVLDELRHLVVAGAELAHQQRQVVDDALDVVLARLERAEHLAPVARGRLEAPDRARQRAPVAAQPLTAGAEQDGQVVARVGVQRREDLVEVDVRQRLAHRDRVALVQPARGGRPRLELGHHVLQPGLGPQQHGRVAVDAAVLRLHLHGDDGLAVLELDVRDLADLDARDVHGLALARRDRLRGRHVGLEDEEVLADERDPRGQREPLLAEDEHRDRARDHDQAEDRHEVDPVLADRGPHGVPSPGPPAPAGPLTFGILLL